MKTKVAFTVTKDILDEVERLRGREKRSTFLEHLIKLGLEVYRKRSREGCR